MKVGFIKTNYEFRQHDYAYKPYTDHPYLPGYTYKSFHYEEISKINEILKDMFPSIIIDKRISSVADRRYTCYYKFNEVSDEAAFILWSANRYPIDLP